MRKNDRQNLLFLHLGFWLVFLFIKLFDYKQNLSYEQSLILIAVQNFFTIIGSYIHYFMLLPMAVQQKNYGRYIPLLVFLVLLMIGLRAYTESMVLNGYFNTDYYNKWTLARFLSLLLNIGSFILFTSFMKFTFDRFILERQKKELENEKLNAELNYLKAQINPHFLFNTLHNLNYLIQAKHDKGSEVVIRLSNIMRYMIYDSNKPKVPVEKEVSYMKDYLSLEEIRLNNKFDIQFHTDLQQSDVYIAPLILIPLVENAFKHGVSDTHPDSWVDMSLRITNNHLFFTVKNSLIEPQKNMQEKSGFGLENLRKRLALTYPNYYKLETRQDKNKFEVDLHIDLK